MPTVYIAYGSNMGHRQKNIHDAKKLLDNAGIKVHRMSQSIETKPLGGVPQANYLNGVFAAETKVSAQKLLKTLKGIEKKLGRTPTIKNGPRPIDLDILLYGNKTIRNKTLQIPHPQTTKRYFVLKPLNEIISDPDKKLLCSSQPQLNKSKPL